MSTVRTAPIMRHKNQPTVKAPLSVRLTASPAARLLLAPGVLCADNLTLTGEARAIYDGLMRSDAWEYELL